MSYFPNRRNRIIIGPLVVPKRCCLYRLNRRKNLLDPVRKIKTVTRMKVDRNKGICTDFGSNVLGACRDNHNKLPLGDPDMDLPSRHIQELPCMSLVLICLKFIICLIESACTSLLLPNLNPLLCKILDSLREIHVRLEAIIFEEFPPPRVITYHLQIIWRDINGEYDI